MSLKYNVLSHDNASPSKGIYHNKFIRFFYIHNYDKGAITLKMNLKYNNLFFNNVPPPPWQFIYHNKFVRHLTITIITGAPYNS
jgi:hypothetical protein